MKEKCTRCGLCCSWGPGGCGYGYENVHGDCPYQYYVGVISHCELLEEGKITKEELGIGSGCFSKTFFLKYTADYQVIFFPEEYVGRS